MTFVCFETADCSEARGFLRMLFGTSEEFFFGRKNVLNNKRNLILEGSKCTIRFRRAAMNWALCVLGSNFGVGIPKLQT